MYRKLIISTAIFVLLLSPACSRERLWKSTPALQTFNSPSYVARFEPLKKEADFFNWFRLTVMNKTGKDMEIDWNRTKYIHKGKDQGLFVFSGIAPYTVKNLTIPADVIPANGTFSRDIVPFKLIAFTPLREQSIDTKRHNIIAGLIPEGENGILLVIRQGGKIARAKIVVAIESRELKGQGD